MGFNDGLYLDPSQMVELTYRDWGEPMTAGGVAVNRITTLGVATITLTSGVQNFAFFRAPRTETITTAKTTCGTVAAAATPTILRFGLYLEDAAGNITLVASTTNDLTLFTSINTQVTKALTTPYQIVRGARYACSWICVTAAAAPIMAGYTLANSAGFMTELGVAPRLTGVVTAQSDLIASVAVGSIANSQLLPYHRLA